ncbi:SulP family inorganic anion transporter [Bartonella tamiae]|uniref:STAS domain-containing protein n=1 Tax=Bartonella tamiae Th239 TaxID=1094558 RepID=J0ZPD5_9HYPH|nr:SulP family inorganic anion transporter [Bartonella tamiae]EJF90423.1 hypothetical protein ME5_00824 [Bartonella tamiae Th239]EJF93633.1 hypothetical protein MEG_01057 [Bartonella tamiae Th307]
MKNFRFATFRQEWFGNIRNDVLSGIVVALALIPEAIGFSIIAGVDPKVGLYASVIIAIVISFFGGRTGMISAATAATAVLMGSLVREYGLNYLLAATVLAGLLQICLGVIRVGALMRFVSRSVMTGFVNALAILIFMAQLPELIGPNVAYPTYIMVIAGLAIIYIFPRLTRAIPSPLICILVLTPIAIFGNMDLRTVGDMGELPKQLPEFLIPNVSLNFETLKIIFPYSIAVAAVGLLESLMTANLIDGLTDTDSNKNRECIGQGVANSVTGFFGGMAGCAMIGQSMINIKSGGRGRLSTFIAGFVLLVLMLAFNDWVSKIPMAALVAIMIMVSIGTFSWSSLRDLKKNPKSSSLVTIVVVAFVLATHNLAIGVLAGVLLSTFFFAWKIAKQFRIQSTLSSDGKTRSYKVEGQLFFASVDNFRKSFDFGENIDNIIIDVSKAHIWDISSVAAIDMIVLKFRREGAHVDLIGMNDLSDELLERHAKHNKSNIIDQTLMH